MSDKWKKVGSLWEQESRGGKPYWSGNVTVGGVQINISVWPNDKGDNPKRPDYVIYLNERKREEYRAPAERQDEGLPPDSVFQGDDIPDDGVPF
jgi:uncharacterized protein (DUF736 family)